MLSANCPQAPPRRPGLNHLSDRFLTPSCVWKDSPAGMTFAMSPLLVTSVLGAGHKDSRGVKPQPQPLPLKWDTATAGHCPNILGGDIISRLSMRTAFKVEEAIYCSVSSSNTYWQPLRNRLSARDLWLQKYVRCSSHPQVSHSLVGTEHIRKCAKIGVKRPRFFLHLPTQMWAYHFPSLIPFSHRKDAGKSKSVLVPKGHWEAQTI